MCDKIYKRKCTAAVQELQNYNYSESCVFLEHQHQDDKMFNVDEEEKQMRIENDSFWLDNKTIESLKK